MSDEPLAIQRLDWATLEVHPLIILQASPGKGKTSALFTIMRQLKNSRSCPDHGLAFSGSFDVVRDMRVVMPASLVRHGYDGDTFEKFLDSAEQTEASQHSRNFLVVMDDLGFDKKALKNPQQARMYMNHRHLQMSAIVGMQYIKDPPPFVRQCVDYVFAFGERKRDAREALFKIYFGIFESFKVFEEVFAKATENHGALVINLRSSAARIEDCVFHFKADFADNPCVRKPHHAGLPDFSPFRMFRQVYSDLDNECRRAGPSKPLTMLRLDRPAPVAPKAPAKKKRKVPKDALVIRK